MIDTAKAEDISGCCELAAWYYKEKKRHGTFSREHFTNFWTKLIELGMGLIYRRMTDDGIPAEAMGFVMHPDPYDGATVGGGVFWYACDNSKGLEGGMLCAHAIEDLATRGCVRVYVPILIDERTDKVDNFLVKSGFKPNEILYIKPL